MTIGRGPRLLALGIGWAMAAASLAGQVPDSARARADSARADSLGRDTTDYSELFLKTQEESRTRIASLPRLGSPPLLPALSRYVFDRDTIDWHNAETVGDILTKVPGVFLWRGGWIGRPEPVNFQARGAAAVEYYLDGFRYLALGPDSVSVDPSLLPLSFISRIEVERLPGLLRVHLFTSRHDRYSPKTRVTVASGDFEIARYQGSLEKRFAKGFGYAVAADHLAVPLSSDQQGSYHNTQAWLQTSFVRSNRFAAMVQLMVNSPQRGNVLSQTDDTLSQGLSGRRTDLQASALYSPQGTLGPRLGIQLSRSGWSEDSTALSLGPIPPHEHVKYVDQSVWQVGALAGLRGRTTNFEANAWYRSRWTPLEVRASAATSPSTLVTATVEADYAHHDGSRTSKSVTGRVGLSLPLGLRATALARTGSIVNHPMIETDQARTQTDYGATAGFDRRRIAAEAGYWRTDGFAPETFPLYRTIASIAPSAPTEWITFSGRIAPRQWLVIDGWYSTPRGARPQGQPPTHSIINGTIQSQFLRTFRSGIFGLKLQTSMETWGKGVIGQDVDGDPIELRGATFFRAHIALKIGSFLAYYDRVNIRATRLAYVPGLQILRLASTFGVRWDFSN